MESLVIPTEAIPNQQLSVLLGGNRFVITIKAVGAGVGVSVVMNNQTLIENMRAVSGAPIIPFVYAEAGGGNFMLVTRDDVIPTWQNFGDTCYLLWTDNEELEAYRASV